MRLRRLVLLLVILAAPATARAGGTGDHAVLLVDPTDADSLRLANVYRAARKVPGRNVLVMTPWTDGDYADLADRNVTAFVDALAARGIEDHVDYAVLMPTAQYRVSAPSLVSDGCSPVTRFALASAYTMAFVKADVLGGTLGSMESNRYYASGENVVAFDGTRSWLSGSVSTSASARRYVIGAMLGYTGTKGNTAAELVDLVTRSVASDGARPAGTFYFNETADAARSGPRDWTYPSIVASLAALGKSAEHQDGDKLPFDDPDILGCMTGVADVTLGGVELDIVPGAFCDHLTSFAAAFDKGQSKVSEWIREGASGSAGAIEEPCNYQGKFPHAKLHVFYAQGMTLGEAYLRSARHVPFQILLYGDPLTRPHAHLPVVSVSGVPSEPVTEAVTIRPSATTTHPTSSISRYDLHVDGVRVASVGPGGSFTIDPAPMNDGHHELRVLARDDAPERNVGRWIGSITTSVRSQACTLSVSPGSGDLGTAFRPTVSATGRTVREIRVLHLGRVVASTGSASATLTVHGHLLGAGPVELHAEALFEGGRRARSAPVTIDVAAAGGSTGGTTPIAHSYFRAISPGATHLIELPSSHADAPGDATFTIVEGPSGATVLPGTTAGFRLLRVPASASGTDRLTFRVTTSSGESGLGVVSLLYGVETIEPDPEPDPETLDLVVTRGDIKDKETAGKDRLELRGTWDYRDSSDGALDPAAEAVVLTLGDDAEIFRLEIPADDPGWETDGEIRKWRSPATGLSKIKLKLDLAARTLKLKAKKIDLAATVTGPLLATLGSGDDLGMQEAAWTLKKPGRLKLR